MSFGLQCLEGLCGVSKRGQNMHQVSSHLFTTFKKILLSACKYPAVSLGAIGWHQTSLAGLSLFVITEHTLMRNCYKWALLH